MNLSDLVAVHKQSMPWLERNIILAARHGSHAYGTNLPSSDEDYRGVALAPRNYYTGFLHKFEQAEQSEPFDSVIYEIRKFMNLAADCNPSIVDTLFVDPSDIIHCTDDGETLLLHRDLFLSRKARYTYTGYAISQLKRIQRHYAWLKYPPKKEPTREDFHLPERTVVPADQRAAAAAAIKAKLDEWNVDLEPLDPATRLMVTERIQKALVDIKVSSDDDLWRAAARTIGVDDNFVRLMELERAYNNARNEWKQYLNWQKNRNPDRAELEAKFGYDTKHAMHLVRLMRMGLEIVSTGKVYVKRPDAAELLEIRAGAWTYEQLIEFAQDMEKKIEEASATSPLPVAPNREWLDEVCSGIIGYHLR